MSLDYDAMHAEYSCHRRIHSGVVNQLLWSGLVAPASRVLEVGCGTGNYIVELATRSRARCYGIDPSGGMLEHARTRSTAIEWLEASAEHLPFPGNTFDLIFSVDVVHHIKDRPAFFRDALRVLAPGGRICTVTDSEEDIRRRVPLTRYFPETVSVETERYPAIGVLTREMLDCGFSRLPLEHVELEYALNSASAYRDRAFSSLHLIANDAYERGLARLERDLAAGPITALSLYTLVWGQKPG